MAEERVPRRLSVIVVADVQPNFGQGSVKTNLTQRSNSMCKSRMRWVAFSLARGGSSPVDADQTRDQDGEIEHTECRLKRRPDLSDRANRGHVSIAQCRLGY